MKNDLLIYGGGMLGEQLYRLLKMNFAETHKVLGFIDDAKAKGDDVIDGLQVLGSFDEIRADERFTPEQNKIVMGIGYGTMKNRSLVFKKVKKAGYCFENIIHPNATLEPDFEMGEGNVILGGCVSEQCVKIGDINYLGTGLLIGENCEIGSNNFFSLGIGLAGYICTGDDNFFGIGALVTDKLKMGSRNYIFPSTLVYKNVDDDKTVGSPNKLYIQPRPEDA